MNSWRLKTMAALASLLIGVPHWVAAAAQPDRNETPRFVAGLTAYQRPAGAPVVQKFVSGSDWHARALTGISEPVPGSLGFLDRQGAWYTPFNHPGMPGYYDLRNWHHGFRESNKESR